MTATILSCCEKALSCSARAKPLCELVGTGRSEIQVLVKAFASSFEGIERADIHVLASSEEPKVVLREEAARNGYQFRHVNSLYLKITLHA